MSSVRRGRARYPNRPKQLHINLTAEEHRRVDMIAAAEATTMANLFRAVFLPEIDRRYEALVGSNGGGKGRVRP